MAETIYNTGVIGRLDIQDNPWPNYYDTDLVQESEYVECEGPDNLAYDVLNRYDITCITPSIGGNLNNLDIKKMDARTVINLSLLEYGALEGQRRFYEPFINESNEIEFKAIGSYSGNISDIYYKVQSGTYRQDPVGVMVTGGRPLPVRQPLEWKPIWGESPVEIYSMQDMLGNCHKADFSRYATIAFRDPHLDSQYEDGIDNLYEITEANKYDRILGYVIYRHPPKDYVTEETQIQYATQTSIPIRVGNILADGNGPYMGNLQELPSFDPNVDEQVCWSGRLGDTLEAADGIEVRLPGHLRFEDVRGVRNDKFIGISAVYVIGYRIELLRSVPRDDTDATATATVANSKVWVSINKTTVESFRLDEGTHYGVAYEEGDDGWPVPYIVFAKDTRYGDPHPYGMGTEFEVSSTCLYAQQILGENYKDPQFGSILPMDQNLGIWVHDIWVMADFETPCIIVQDPDGTGDKALNIAQNLRYYVAPIVVEELPNPLAFVGQSNFGSAEIIEQPTYDKDPTTAQDFSDSPYELAMDEMQGGGFSASFSFLNDPDYEVAKDLVINMANTLYDQLNDEVTETIYTCGPECEPQLGGFGQSGGIVNAIRYSYNDSGSYTISVTEGAKIVGNLSQIDGGPTQLMSEDISARGTIIDTRGDNIHFKVRIDGFGERWAVAMCHNIIRIGDVVNCTIHNCPIEA